MTGQKIQHLIVLMLENRSFDHLLGYLEYPPKVSFEGCAGGSAL
jgi:phospholipase C